MLSGHLYSSTNATQLKFTDHADESYKILDQGSKNCEQGGSRWTSCYRNLTTAT
ncbi:hypothetical protein BKA69DRAFT_1107154 [Paraphysoderma sedebokerense]|nr:hypothetical protein BKA69DRAFT_1107154 [Paraphysoderma sedebokerense]